MFEDAAKVILEKSQYLSELDMKGDADFGVNISNGFEKIIEKFAGLQDPDIGTILRTAGDVFVFDIGATIGGLFGRSLQKASKEMQGKRTLRSRDLAAIFRTMLITIKEIGGAKLGDKTLIDALEPAVNAANAENGVVAKDIEELLHRMELAATKGATSTETMVARIGRSSYLGERSRGLIDPGAMFICLFFKGMRESLGQLRHNAQ